MAYKELLAIRNVKMTTLMILMPVLLILILGTILKDSDSFNASATIGQIRVLYKMNSSDGELTNGWNRFVGQAGSSGFVFEEASEDTDGRLEVRNNVYSGYVEIADNGMSYYGNSVSRVESEIAQGLLAAFADRYKLAAEAAKESPEQASALMSGDGRADYVQETSLNAARQPGALGYYAIAMTTLIILYIAMTGAQLMDNERKRNTAVRLLASPVKKTEIFAGIVTGNLLYHAISIVIVVFVSKYVLHVYWGENLGLVLLVLFSEIIFALSLGLGLSYIFKGNVAGALVMTIIQIGAFFGGSYFPIDLVTVVLRTMADFSPLTWTNDALLEIIYSDNGAAAAKAMLLNVGFSVLLLGASLLIMRRREGL